MKFELCSSFSLIFNRMASR